ncbi:hypothetical protein HME9302_00909 [Alteripontixanthobacter maritimus]|uniref:Uncharacterized protein n=1 Tax=Alteripontixanthobacter maritimus TaxID=2161824 RepID=A0A369Q971_9SPHN|nr:hypothetical protein [Alteripontixanthobacter maritimus]RDC59716.1 hypothetical protein HME9302_00909 [Alteripontixanthobacter maritimus]
MKTARTVAFAFGLTGLIGAIWTTSAAAEVIHAVSRSVYVERTGLITQGRTARTLAPANELERGDVVVLMVEWEKPRDDGDLTVSVAVPRALAFTRSSRAGLTVSADGGRHWGRLGQLRHAGRIASPEDVTNLRWTVPPRSGRITYSARVR